MTTTLVKSTNPSDARPALSLGKPTVETKALPETKVVPEKISLKKICAEMKLDPRIAREKLRIAVREAKKFPELAKEARSALTA